MTAIQKVNSILYHSTTKDLLVGTNELELIMITGILDDGVNCRSLKILVTGPKLIKKIEIT